MAVGIITTSQSIIICQCRTKLHNVKGCLMLMVAFTWRLSVWRSMETRSWAVSRSAFSPLPTPCWMRHSKVISAGPF